MLHILTVCCTRTVYLLIFFMGIQLSIMKIEYTLQYTCRRAHQYLLKPYLSDEENYVKTIKVSRLELV